MSKNNSGLTYLMLATISQNIIQNSLLGNAYSDPIVLSTLQKHRGSNFP
jgi:hypothetical protein